MTTTTHPSRSRTISRRLAPDDFAWALDHSRRRYRVRPSRRADHPIAFLPGGCSPKASITVLRLQDGAQLIFSAASTPFPTWANTDRYAALRWRLRAGTFDPLFHEIVRGAR